MLQIIEENRKPTFSEKLNMGMSGVNRELKQYQAQQEKRREEQRLAQKSEQEQLFELNKMGLQHGYNKELEQIKQISQQGKQQQESQEKLAPYISGLQTVQQLRNIRNKENIGFGSGFTGVFDPETRRDRGEYQTLANSLISLASTIPIRNQREFETLTGKLNDPSLTLDEIDGVLDGIERIIAQNMQQHQGMDQMGGFQNQRQNNAPSHLKKPKKSLTSFMR